MSEFDVAHEQLVFGGVAVCAYILCSYASVGETSSTELDNFARGITGYPDAEYVRSVE